MKLLLGQVHSGGFARHEVLTIGVLEDCTLAMFIVGSFVVTGTMVGRRLADSIWLPNGRLLAETRSTSTPARVETVASRIRTVSGPCTTST